jgi:hypothetical protein
MLSITVSEKSGANTVSNWNVGLSGETGKTGASGPLGPSGPTGPTGPKGDPAAYSLRGASNSKIALTTTGATKTLNASATDAFYLELSNTTTLSVSGMNNGQQVYIFVETTPAGQSGGAEINWDSNVVITWRDKDKPRALTTSNRGVLIKLIKINDKILGSYQKEYYN